MTEWQAIADLIRSLGVGSIFAPALSLVLLSYILKKYVFAGWGQIIHVAITGFFQREKEQVRVQTEVAGSLLEIVRQLEALTKKVSDEINESNDRIRSLEMAMSDYLDEFRDLNDIVKDAKTNMLLRPCIKQGGDL